MQLSFDTYLSEEVGFGPGQLRQFTILSLIVFIDGFTILFMMVMLNILKLEWNLSNSQVIILATVYFIGMTVGLLLSGLYTDYLGRKHMLSISMFSTFIFVVWHAYAYHYVEVFILRFAFGFFQGSSLQITLILMAEQVPLAYRGKVVVTLQLVYLIGMYYVFLCGWIFLDSLDEGNWRGIFIMNIIPVFLCFLASQFLLKESPRFTLLNSQYQQTFKLLDQMKQLNETNSAPISCSQKDSLIKWQRQMRYIHNSRSISDLFNEQNRKVTSYLWAIMLLWNLQSSSILIIAPFVLSASGNGLFSMFISYLWELPAQVFVVLTIDSQKWGGRKRMIIYGLIVFIAAEFYIYTYKADSVVIGLALIRIADKLVWPALNQLKLESYLTFYRTLGVGMSETVGKVASSVSGVVVLSVFAIDPYLPFLLLGLMSVFTLTLTALFPVDLTQQPLDSGLLKQQRIK